MVNAMEKDLRGTGSDNNMDMRPRPLLASSMSIARPMYQAVEAVSSAHASSSRRYRTVIKAWKEGIGS